jgi:hypothetical protein
VFFQRREARDDGCADVRKALPVAKMALLAGVTRLREIIETLG